MHPERASSPRTNRRGMSFTDFGEAKKNVGAPSNYPICQIPHISIKRIVRNGAQFSLE